MTISLKTSMRLVLIPPLLLVMAGALAAVVFATCENLRLSRAENQILGLVNVARNYAAQQPGFGEKTGEDLLTVLAHAGQMPEAEIDGQSAKLTNPWKGSIRAVVAAPQVLRVESDLDAANCRRVALAFLADLKGLGIQGIEVRNKDAWLAAGSGTDLALMQASLENACNQSPNPALAALFSLR